MSVSDTYVQLNLFCCLGFIFFISEVYGLSHCHRRPQSRCVSPVWGRGTPLPLVHLLPHLSPFYFSLSFIGFAYFLRLSIPSLSTRIVPLRFQAGGRRRRPNLGLVCVLFCNLCCLYSLVKMDCGVLLYLVVCSFSALTLLVGSFDP